MKSEDVEEVLNVSVSVFTEKEDLEDSKISVDNKNMLGQFDLQ